MVKRKELKKVLPEAIIKGIQDTLEDIFRYILYFVRYIDTFYTLEDIYRYILYFNSTFCTL